MGALIQSAPVLFALFAMTGAAQTPSFDYDRSQPFDLRTITTDSRGSVRIDDVSFANLSGGRTQAYIVRPGGRKKTAGALFVHWYDPESPLSNRKQFLEEAIVLAPHDLTSLLVETPWSDPQWYPRRYVERDYENSVAEVKELRRALDLLRAQPHVDPKRIALVGHDFGAMYGILAAAETPPKISAIALQAFAPRFGDWFLYNQQKLTPEGKKAVIDRLAPLDPIRFLPRLGATPVLMQFANKDFYVPREQAEALSTAVTGPKQILWYESGHGLNEQASRDRQQWLRRALRLK